MHKIKFLLLLSLFSGYLTAQETSSTAITYQSLLKQEITKDNINKHYDKPYVIMLSLDGFRHDYAQRYSARNILAIKENGSSLRRLISSFPSKTFPNHYTIATGLYPANHGLITNHFYSRSRAATYMIGDRSTVEDGTWYGGTPIWNLAEQQGMVSASFFWVGSEADIQGIHPSYYFRFDSTVPYEMRVKRVLDWLALPDAKRPHMITFYFSLTDTIGHQYGPDSPEIEQAVLLVDKQIGILREGIKASGLPVTLIVTSDHGMTPVTTPLNINDYVDLKDNQFIGAPVSMIYTTSPEETERLFTELSKVDAFETYKNNALPSYMNFENTDRIGDLVIVVPAPATLGQWEDQMPDYFQLKGNHGYDPYSNIDMGGILYIEGPGIHKDLELGAVENIHIYPLIAHILGLEITEPIDGRIEVLSPMLK